MALQSTLALKRSVGLSENSASGDDFAVLAFEWLSCMTRHFRAFVSFKLGEFQKLSSETEK